MLTTLYPPYHFGGDAIYVQRLASSSDTRPTRTWQHSTTSSIR